MKYLYPIRIALLGIVGCLLTGNILQAQHDYELNNQGALITIQANADVYVWGDVYMEGATATLDNDGFLEVQGNMFSDNLFQQRGTGTVRLENNDVNTNDRQFIEGSYAVRGGQAQIGTNDGSFYDLELANTQGVVHLVGGGNVADVRNSVDFNPVLASGTPPVNRIVTHDTTSLPANGSGYAAVFGMMNPAPGIAGFANSSVALGGNMSGLDVGYVQGNLRRAILPAGGSYGYLEGLEPAGAAAARGFQYVLIDFAANNYDVVTSYYEQGSPNVIPGSPNQCGFLINYFAGADHGEWMFSDRTGSGAGNYEVRIWPQDGTWIPQSTWFITKDNAIQGTIGDCGPTSVGLDRSAFNGFLSPSEFDFAGGSVILNANELHAEAFPRDNRFIEVRWTNPEESNLLGYQVERSLDGTSFTPLGTQPALGNDNGLHQYQYPDPSVISDTDYYYRVKFIDFDGNDGYSNTVLARIDPNGLSDEIQLFPVPVGEDGLTLQFLSSVNKAYTFRVFDAIGKLVFQQEIQVDAGLSQRIIDTREWAIGTYFIHLQSESESLVKEIVRHQ